MRTHTHMHTTHTHARTQTQIPTPLQAYLLLINTAMKFIDVCLQRCAHTSPHICICTHTMKACKLQMKHLSAESFNTRMPKCLTQFLFFSCASDTHITGSCVQSLTNQHSQTLMGSASSASGPPCHDWSTQSLAVNGWEHRGGLAVSGTGPQMTCHRFGASDGRYAHLWLL